ncbi:hypothetical protein MTO96_007968 [Rhipicephalus appendiculatus]
MHTAEAGTTGHAHAQVRYSLHMLDRFAAKDDKEKTDYTETNRSASIWTTEELVTDLSLPGAPNATLDVRYNGSLQVTLGNKLTPQQASTAPTVCLRNVSVGLRAAVRAAHGGPGRDEPSGTRSSAAGSTGSWSTSTPPRSCTRVTRPCRTTDPRRPRVRDLTGTSSCCTVSAAGDSRDPSWRPRSETTSTSPNSSTRLELGQPLAGNFFFAENP